MKNDSLTLPRPGMSRPSTAMPVRRTFSSPGELNNRENALENNVNRIAESLSFLEEHLRVNRPCSSSRFAPVRSGSAQVPDAEPDQHTSPPRSQDNDSGQHASHENHTDASDSQENQRNESHQSTRVVSSYEDIQAVIDSSLNLKNIPDLYQDGFDRMKGKIENTISELSKERRRSSKLSRDAEALRKQHSSLSRNLETLRHELDEFREKENAAKAQIANQNKALKEHASDVERLKIENEKLKELSRRDHEENEKIRSEMKQEKDTLSKGLELAKRDIRFKDEFLGQVRRDVKAAKKKFDEEVRRREDTETELDAAKQRYKKLEASYRDARNQSEASREDNEARITTLKGLNESQRELISVLEASVRKQKEITTATESELAEMVSFLRRISRAVEQVFRATSIHGCAKDELRAYLSDSARRPPQDAHCHYTIRVTHRTGRGLSRREDRQV